MKCDFIISIFLNFVYGASKCLHYKENKIEDEHLYEEEDNIPLSNLFALDDEYQNIINHTDQLLTNIASNDNITSEEITEWNIDAGIDELEDDEDSIEEEEIVCEKDSISVPSYDEAIKYVNGLIQWSNANKTPKHFENLLLLRENIVKN